MVTFSYILGSVSASMGELRKMHEDHAQNFWLVRRYLRQQGVRIDLSLRIQKYLEKKFQGKQKQLQASDVPLFKALSQQLQNEMFLTRIGKHIEFHPLFGYLQDERVFLGKLTEKAVTEQHFAVDIILRRPG